MATAAQGKAKNWATAFNAAQKRRSMAKLVAVVNLASPISDLRSSVHFWELSWGGIEAEAGTDAGAAAQQTLGQGPHRSNGTVGGSGCGDRLVAPDRACEDEFVQPEANGTAVEPEAESEEESWLIEPVEPVAEPETGSDAEEEVVTDKEDETGSDAEEEDVVTDEEKDLACSLEVTPPSPPAPESNSRAALLRQIQGGFKLKKTKEMPAPAPAPPSRDGLLKAIQGGVKLKPVNKRELQPGSTVRPPKPKESTAHSDLMNQIKVWGLPGLPGLGEMEAAAVMD
eukprot:Skav204834  [mRNA]  locus=scaffold2524:87351:96146:- [translate_table: standard]